MQQVNDVGLVSSQVLYNNDKATSGSAKLTMALAAKHSNAASDAVQHGSSPNDKPIDGGADKAITLSDMIGEFGTYQLSLTLITFIRYICVAMMTNTGPLIAPDVDFSCNPPTDFSSSGLSISKKGNTTLLEHLKGQCHLNLSDGSEFKCSSWTYNLTEHGTTLTDSFNLVCDREFLRSLFQSSVSMGVVVAAIMWGSFSDLHGRNLAIKVSFICSLISGIASYFAESLLVYSISRTLCSFSDLGLVGSLSTIIVETLGNKYRGVICIIVYTGWAFGVMIMPWITEYFRDYKQLMLFTIVCHLITLPWLMTINESVRWSLVNGYIDEANSELKRISWWNLKGDKESIAELDSKFEVFKVKYVISSHDRRTKRDMETADASKLRVCCNMLRISTIGAFSKVVQVFQTKELAITTTTLIWITFNSELLYMLSIYLNSIIGDNIELNYLIGGIMETLATFSSMVLIAYVTRKLSLISTLLSISFLCFVISFKHEDSTISVYLLGIAKLAISNLSSLIYVTTTESFPTDLRQTGFGTVGTFGSLGAMVAPFVSNELEKKIGLGNVMLLFVILPLSAAFIIPFLLRETKGVELVDDVDDVGTGDFDTALRRRGSSISKWNATTLAVERV